MTYSKPRDINYLCTYDLYSPVHNVLDACISITRGSRRGLGPGIPEFLGPVNWHRADRRVPFGAMLRKKYFDCPQKDSHAVHYI
jgi:hypothetical protein